VWAVADIGEAKVVLFKSDLHPATDGIKLPMVVLWQQIVGQVKPSLVITTGTAGGVGAGTQLGDVVATGSVRWDADSTFGSEPWAHTTFTSDSGQAVLELAAVQALLEHAQSVLMPVNAKVPRTGTPQILGGTTVTTDFFAFDDAADHYGLRAYEPDTRAVEMDDAALGLACVGLSAPPPWLSVRNASDPQMNLPSLAEEKLKAADVYREYGYYTTTCSAIACWAIIAGLI
jgi:nucleoside phosphorylase